jgi:hypothetical protein
MFQPAIVYRNPRRRAMLKCNSLPRSGIGTSSPTNLTPQPRGSNGSPTLYALLARLPQLSRLSNASLAAIVDFVELELTEGKSDEAPSRPIARPVCSPTGWGWRNR